MTCDHSINIKDYTPGAISSGFMYFCKYCKRFFRLVSKEVTEEELKASGVNYKYA